MGFKSTLSEKDLEKARKELNEDPKTRDEKIKELRKACKSNSNIPSVCWVRLDDGFLLRYLRVAKFDIAKASDKIQKLFELQRDWPEVFGNFHYDSVKHVIKNSVVEIMGQDTDGVHLMTMTSANWDVNLCTAADVHVAGAFIREYLLLNESVQVNGVRFVGDHGGITWAHMKAMGMKAARMGGRMEQAYPFRTRKSAIINCPGWILTLHNIFKKFLSQKVQDRIVMLSRDDDMEKLYAQIPRENLPEKLGGHMKPDIAWKKDLAEKAMQIEKDFAYLKQLCNPNGSYTPIVDEPDMDLAQYKQIEEEANGTEF